MTFYVIVKTMNDKNLKTVVMIGRPNVGKSTLFNRLIEKRIAIETPIPGTTRDRLIGEVKWGGTEFNLMDVAGVEFGSKSEIDKGIQAGVQFAIENADLILFVVDWNDKDNQLDKRIAQLLRKTQKEILIVVNKADNIERQQDVSEFNRLGAFHIVPASGISGKNTGDLLDEIVKKLASIKLENENITIKSGDSIRLSIIGRPNVGKSTLLNTIIGEKRAVVSEEAGTTRDVIRINFMHEGKNIEMADTAGIRRPGKVEKDTIESFSLLRTMKALQNSDVAIIVIDAIEGLVALDTNILGKAKEWGKGAILAINKLDLAPTDQKDFMARKIWELQAELNFAPWLPIVFISAKDDQNIKPLLKQVVEVYNNRKTIIPQKDLDEILAAAKQKNPQLLDITSILQKKTTPPIFEVKYKGKSAPHYTQIRYLENKIRDVYPLTGTPLFIDLAVKGKKRSL